jgi:hypothetical protein
LGTLDPSPNHQKTVSRNWAQWKVTSLAELLSFPNTRTYFKMGFWLLEDRVMEHVTYPGVPATGATFQPHIYVFQVQLDTSMIRTDLRLREKNIQSQVRQKRTSSYGLE